MKQEKTIFLNSYYCFIDEFSFSLYSRQHVLILFILFFKLIYFIEFNVSAINWVLDDSSINIARDSASFNVSPIQITP